MTTHPLSKQELQDIEARAEKATAGPWALAAESMPARKIFIVAGPAGFDDDVVVCEIFRATDTTRRDAAFIAHARTDIPALLAYVKTLEAEVERVKERCAVAAENAQLPDHFQWGTDASAAFAYGCERAGEAIRALSPLAPEGE